MQLETVHYAIKKVRMESGINPHKINQTVPKHDYNYIAMSEWPVLLIKQNMYH